MARSIERPAAPAKAVRGFVPAQNDEESFLMRHIEDLARAAHSRGMARYSAFLSDREQELAKAALNRAGFGEEYRFDGGWNGAERRLLCIEPENCGSEENPLRCVRIDCRCLPGAKPPEHKDYLGSLMGLELRREALGDIVLHPQGGSTAYVFALREAAALICGELRSVGRAQAEACEQPLETLPVFGQAERVLRSATVASLRLDSVLAAMLHCSRGTAAQLIEAGRVEIGHLPASSAHAQVYEGDIFTVRGKGRFELTALPGKSKKDRAIIEFFQY